GVPCSEVDLRVRAYYEEHALWENWRHHVGHAIGLRYHEGPFLDRGDETEIRPGMVFTVEPGLYAAGLGGFRHSDTVAVTDDAVAAQAVAAGATERFPVADQPYGWRQGRVIDPFGHHWLVGRRL